ncbi:MAG: anthranilate synthase component I [Dehalococcoidia bacterium]|nr:anthranilate synthase component I [Dehalococcoidia bacterium]MSQ17104.1 anthranilate synthase component I [Dehalococcoidia bacterium]
MYNLTLKEVKALAGQGNLVPVYRTISGDLETPVSAYLKVARSPYSFLLESVVGGERLGRYSFIGTDPYRVLKTGPGQPGGAVDPLRLVEAELAQYQLVPVPNLPRFHGGAVGYLAYDVIRYFEPRVPPMPADPLGLPESVIMFTDSLVIFDHLRHDIKVVSHVRLDGDVDAAYASAVDKIEELVGRLSQPLELPPTLHPARRAGAAPPQIASNFTHDQYCAAVERGMEYINAGDIIQVVLSQRLARPTEAHPFQIYRSLRGLNPSPYMYYLDLEDFHIVGASIETLVKVEDGHLDYHPIAGTRPRGKTDQEDAALEAELKGSEKQRAEHIMLVDLGRNDVGRVSLPGSVAVTQLMEVERYSHVMHLVSHVVGNLRPELTPYDALRSCFPAGTLSGAPKIRAMEIISEIEGEKRGAYAGAVGYFSFSGNIDTAITLRTSVIKDGVVYIQVGGGVVADSTPEDEYQETFHKAAALLKAIDLAEGRG